MAGGVSGAGARPQGINGPEQAGEVYGPQPAAPPSLPTPAEAAAQATTRPAQARPDTLAGDLLASRLAPPPKPADDFADRMAKRFAGREKLSLDDLPGASRKGIRGDLNKQLVKLANTDVKLADKAEEAIRDAIAGKLRDANAQGNVPDDQIGAIAGALAKELRTARVAGVNVESLARGAELLVLDLGKLVTRKVAFDKTEAEIKAEAAKQGGLYPGQDVAVNDKVAAPLAFAVKAEAKKIDDRIKADAYFKADAKVDVKKIFSDARRVLGEASVTGGFKFTGGDFRSDVGAKIQVMDPLTAGATARVTGFAEVGKGNFSARVEGKAEVQSLYTDPKLGPAVDLGLSLRYADPRITASLDAKATLPFDRGPIRYQAGAGLGVNLSKSSALTFTGSVASDGLSRPSYSAMVGLSVKF